jgi:hypothetical protein
MKLDEINNNNDNNFYLIKHLQMHFAVHVQVMQQS